MPGGGTLRSIKVVGFSEPNSESRCISRCPYEVLKLYGEGVPNLFPSHGLFGLVEVE